MEGVFTVHISVRRYETLCTFMQCMYVGRHIRIYVHTCYIAYAYIHTYIHTYVRTYIHTYRHVILQGLFANWRIDHLHMCSVFLSVSVCWLLGLRDLVAHPRGLHISRNKGKTLAGHAGPCSPPAVAHFCCHSRDEELSFPVYLGIIYIVSVAACSAVTIPWIRNCFHKANCVQGV